MKTNNYFKVSSLVPSMTASERPTRKEHLIFFNDASAAQTEASAIQVKIALVSAWQAKVSVWRSPIRVGACVRQHLAGVRVGLIGSEWQEAR